MNKRLLKAAKRRLEARARAKIRRQDMVMSQSSFMTHTPLGDVIEAKLQRLAEWHTYADYEAAVRRAYLRIEFGA